MSQHQQQDDTQPNCKVYISNINKSLQRDDLMRKFSQFGVIKSLILKKKQNNVTFCFIQYDKQSEAKLAIQEMDKKTYYDRVLKVQHGRGGNRGLPHYNNNKFNKYRNSTQRNQERRDRRSRSSYSSYSSPRRHDYRDRNSRSPHRDDRRRPYPGKYDRPRSRSGQRRYQGGYRDRNYQERREYGDRPQKDDRYYNDRYYRDDRYRKQQRGGYRQDNYPKYPGEDRYRQRSPKKRQNQYPHNNDRYGERFDRNGPPRDYRRDNFDYNRRDQPIQRKDNKDMMPYQPRPNGFPYERKRSGSRSPRNNPYP